MMSSEIHYLWEQLPTSSFFFFSGAPRKRNIKYASIKYPTVKPAHSQNRTQPTYINMNILFLKRVSVLNMTFLGVCGSTRNFMFSSLESMMPPTLLMVCPTKSPMSDLLGVCVGTWVYAVKLWFCRIWSGKNKNICPMSGLSWNEDSDAEDFTYSTLYWIQFLYEEWQTRTMKNSLNIS